LILIGIHEVTLLRRLDTFATNAHERLSHTTLEQALAQAALRMALLRRRPAPGLLHHFDRGVQYAANDDQALLVAHAITPSMSRKGNCYDNAVVESFFATIE
jgi:transposase InsO family protein